MANAQSFDENTKSAPGSDDARAPQKGPASSPIPPLNLPKGGGAIRGIGEKFTANPVNGSGSLSVPVYTSPGRSGFGPQLALTYDSGTGNSAFGFGWSLALASVTRKTDKGLPRYDDSQESDTFILSGAEDMMPELIEADGKWIRDVRTRALFGKRYSVHRYRPRVDAAFSRIERWSNLDDPRDTFWRSITKDNLTNWYGTSEDSRIADPQDPSRIFSWLICRTHDDKGNLAVYEYKRENSENVDPALANERNRTAVTRSANRYIKRILYGNRHPYFPDPDAGKEPPLPREWCFEAVFDYGEHNQVDPRPQEIGAWLCREDPFSTYRSTFEVRTYRLCRRVLMFHHFPEEESAGANCLVRSTDFVHARFRQEIHAQRPFYSYLLSVRQTGYRPSEAGAVARSMPPLEFEYTEAIVDETVHEVDPQSLENLPYGIDGAQYRWVDLDGEGLSGILTEQAGSWFYKANLSPVNRRVVDGKAQTFPLFGPTEVVAKEPSIASLSSGRQKLFDLSGDGRLSLVDFAGAAPGFLERTENADWKPFRTFESLPVLDWQSPELRFVDVTGDGFADALISEGDAFWWYESLATRGFGEGHRVPQALDEEKGPRLVFADSTESIFLADFSGDGLSDLVRIRQGEVCCWPNRGYGRFGAKVTMDHAPVFDFEDAFDGRRIQLADIDGSGTADIIYFASGSVHLYFNQSGNGWGDARVLDHFPAVDSASSARAMDFLGNGTACLVWSSPLPGNAQRPLRYIDLMGNQKPHLLVRVNDNLGRETVVRYAPSTKFYVADKLAGTPWVTRLPFPVHVVEQERTYDYIGRNLIVSRYSYHHGYYDGVEREFRGFGRLDRWDTEELATLSSSNEFPPASNLDAASNVPPVYTKTWMHTGAFFGENRISRHLAHEYYYEDGLSDEQRRAMSLDDTLLPSTILFADGSRASYDFSGEEMREACRALRGSILRQEIYGLDGSEATARPYLVSERNYTIEAFQPRGPNLYGTFYSHHRETVDLRYDRLAPADPRASHSFTLAVDPFGNVLESASIAYGRRRDDPALGPEEQAEQRKILSTFTLTDCTNAVDLENAHRIPLPAESRTYELIQIRPDSHFPGITNLFRFGELRGKIEAARSHNLPYQDFDPCGLDPAHPYRRLIECARTFYRPDDMGAAVHDIRALLPLGTLEALALTGDTYKLAFTRDLIDQVFWREGVALVPARVDVLGSDAPDGGGYTDLDGDGAWWIPSGRLFYAADPQSPELERRSALSNFFCFRRFEDAFGNATIADYDRYDLLPVKRIDARGNVVTAQNDYRVLAAALLTDPNGNRAGNAFDALGHVAATAVMGKPGADQGDLLSGFEPDLTQAQIDAFYNAADPHTIAAPLLGNATSRVVYDVNQFLNSRKAAPADPTKWLPVFAATIVRETHYFDLQPGQESVLQISFSYSDGFAREIQKKLQSEPGPVVEGGPVVDPRWVGSGWTIFNNKGKPVRQYEPFFSQLPRGHQFEFGTKVGVSPILCYDPMERVIATIRPNRSFEKTIFEPWRQVVFDLNDTVLETNPANDPDVGGYFARLAPEDYLPTWYAQRVTGALGPLEEAAAKKTAEQANTPKVDYFDPLGRGFLTVDDNGPAGKYRTRTQLDIQGRRRSVTDALDRKVAIYDYDLSGRQIRRASMEAGERWDLDDANNQPIRGWDSRGHNFRTAYDVLRRAVEWFVLGTNAHSDPRTTAGEVLFEKVEYGEDLGDASSLNLRTRIYRHFDGAGILTNKAYDFKGNLLSNTRQFTVDPAALPDWSKPAPPFAADLFTTATTFDALNRITTSITPDGSVAHPVYNPANLLEQLSVHLRGAGEATAFVTNIDYNAKGQRVLIEYANATASTYDYDPLTFRITRLATRRAGFPAVERKVQDLRYTYDPIGNVTHIQDDADIHDTIFFRNRRVDPSSDFTYDALYRLIQATGREHLGRNAGGPQSPPPESFNDVPRVHLLAPGDGNAMGTYLEQYLYDAVGNFLKLVHRGSDPANPGWTRSYHYQDASQIEPSKISNRLSRTVVDGSVLWEENYSYDPLGNLTRMPQLHTMQWDFKGHLLMTQRQATHDDDRGERTYYVYNTDGERVRKATESSTGRISKNRFYLPGFEAYREYDSRGETSLERQTLHVVDDKRRIALVETRTDHHGEPAIRYQLSDHLSSAAVELDELAAVITYEEYYPYGCTSYQAGRTIADASLKRYRFTGKERDDETGLYYNLTRYYAPWLGVWTSADPAGVEGGINLFRYAHNNPVALVDPGGTQPALAPFIDPDTALVVAKTALERATAAWGTDAALYLGGGAAAAAPAAAAAAPVAVAAPAAAAAPIAEAAPLAATEGLGAAAGPLVAGVAFAASLFMLTRLHMQRSGSIARYGNPWGVPKDDIAFPELRAIREIQQQAPRQAPVPVPLPKPKPEEEDEESKVGRIYVTYTKYNTKTKLTYSGRTSMLVDLTKPLGPQADAAVAARDANHHVNYDENKEPQDRGFRPAVRDQYAVGKAIKYANRYSDPAYLAIRGREQQLIDFHGGAQSDTKPLKKTENTIRGVAKDQTVWGPMFHRAANLFFGQLHAYTGN